jgi:hypothetical protein
MEFSDRFGENPEPRVPSLHPLLVFLTLVRNWIQISLLSTKDVERDHTKFLNRNLKGEIRLELEMLHGVFSLPLCILCCRCSFFSSASSAIASFKKHVGVCDSFAQNFS